MCIGFFLFLEFNRGLGLVVEVVSSLFCICVVIERYWFFELNIIEGSEF